MSGTIVHVDHPKTDRKRTHNNHHPTEITHHYDVIFPVSTRSKRAVIIVDTKMRSIPVSVVSATIVPHGTIVPIVPNHAEATE